MSRFKAWSTGRLMLKLLLVALLYSMLMTITVCSEYIPPPPGAKELTIKYEIKGTSAELSCQIKDLGKRKAVWSRLSHPYPISVGSSRFNPDKKYKVEAKGDTFILTIRHLSLGDSGEYQCRVTGPVFIADVISLNIQSDPQTTHIIPTETKIIGRSGSTVILPCEVENINSRLVLWKTHEGEVLSLRKKTYNGDRRYRIIHDTRPQWSLRIEVVQESDYGFYTCVVNSNPVLTRTVQLINPEPRQFSPVLMEDSRFTKRLETDAGEKVVLTCNFRSNPPPKVNWYKRQTVNGKMVKKALHVTGNTFTISSAQPKDSGDYICNARNGVKPSGRGRTRLLVKAPVTLPTTPATTFVPTGPSAPYLYHENEMIKPQRGKEANIKCIAIGQPRPKIYWTRHGNRIENNHKYLVTFESFDRFSTHSTLMIRSVSSRDYGEYSCIGYNQLGLKTLRFKVVVSRR